jgi:Tol biopolymer transport system component
MGGFDLYLATRPDTNSPFGEPVNLMEINSAEDDGSPSISADGLHLYFHSQRDGGRRLYVAERTTANEPFTKVEPIPLGVNNAAGADISADDRALYFHADDPNGLGGADLWVITRDAIGAPWSAPTTLQSVNSSANDSGPSIDSYGTTLYFASARDDNPPNNIVVATRPDRFSLFGDVMNMPNVSTMGTGEYDPDISYDDTTIAYALNRSWIATRSCPASQ